MIDKLKTDPELDK
jgi:tubulin polyglutamylase TTLL6/13